jgi:hypothetical protein
MASLFVLFGSERQLDTFQLTDQAISFEEYCSADALSSAALFDEKVPPMTVLG